MSFQPRLTLAKVNWEPKPQRGIHPCWASRAKRCHPCNCKGSRSTAVGGHMGWYGVGKLGRSHCPGFPLPHRACSHLVTLQLRTELLVHIQNWFDVLLVPLGVHRVLVHRILPRPLPQRFVHTAVGPAGPAHNEGRPMPKGLRVTYLPSAEFRNLSVKLKASVKGTAWRRTASTSASTVDRTTLTCAGVMNPASNKSPDTRSIW